MDSNRQQPWFNKKVTSKNLQIERMQNLLIHIDFIKKEIKRNCKIAGHFCAKTRDLFHLLSEEPL